MIEVIFDKDNEKQEGGVEESNIRTDKEEVNFKLPKNIRQIGSPSGNKRIYIEDYVVTYLNYIARPGSTHARGAILLGENKKTEIGDVLFISGAVEAQNLEFDMDESEFTKEAWADIYEQVKENFPDLSVVGWFLSRMGFSTAINDKIEKMHVDNFPGKDKVLYITDSLESDDAFYMYEHGQMLKQKGYYIYYTKNEAMQSYIIKQKGGSAEEENNEIRRKDEELIKTYRDKNNRVQGNKSNGFSLMYVASSFVVLAMLAMGVTVISNYDKMKEMEVSINRLELTAEVITEDEIVETMNDDVISTELATSDVPMENTEYNNEGNVEDITTEVISETDVDNTTGTTTEEVAISTEQNIPVISDENPTYYEIQYGDTLSSIAFEQYGSSEYARDIAEANNMDVDDKIYEGEELILPVISTE
ncbi:MAG: LysM peptidoglycan-binding domain-containing protein [Lachnospiraceae bacterium]|nr:LysM peptidoglycan-binding domain-containing protein [Lachnospiraceae bacterium]